MSDVKVGIGTIKYLANKRGVIAPNEAQPGGLVDLYFEVGDDEASRLRQGQLVQFVVEGDEAKQVAVLSENA